MARTALPGVDLIVPDAAAMMPALPPTASRRRWQAVSRLRPEQPAGRTERNPRCAPSGGCGNEQLGLGIHSRRGRDLHVLRHHRQDVGIGCVSAPPWLASKQAFGALQARPPRYGSHRIRVNGARQRSTTLRYRCQVACPSTGITTERPTNKGKEPISRATATMRPHMAIVIGFARTALIDV